MGVGDQYHRYHATTAFRLGTYNTEDWVDPRTCLDGCRKSPIHRGSVPGPSHLHLYVVITRRSMRQSLGNLKRRNALSHIGRALRGKVLSYWILGAFAKLRKATISFVISVRLPVRPHGTIRLPDFHKILYLRIFKKSVEKITICRYTEL